MPIAIDTKMWTGKLSNGVEFEVHQSDGFSNHSEMAIKIGDQFVCIIKTAPKRNGNIEVIPTTTGKTLIKMKKEEVPEIQVSPDSQPVDLLSGVIDNTTND